MSFFEEFALLFTGMSIPAIICLIMGVIFIIIEIFEPGFGVFGILGGILAVAGIVLRVIVGDGNAFAQIFILLFIYMIIIVVAFLIMVFASKRGWLKRSPLIMKSTAVSETFSAGTENYNSLIGKRGVATTDLRPTGKVSIDGGLYDVVTDGFYIKKDESVVVSNVEGGKITVTRVE